MCASQLSIRILIIQSRILVLDIYFILLNKNRFVPSSLGLRFVCLKKKDGSTRGYYIVMDCALYLLHLYYSIKSVASASTHAMPPPASCPGGPASCCSSPCPAASRLRPHRLLEISPPRHARAMAAAPSALPAHLDDPSPRGCC
jgi:hypothetical protein